MSDHTDESNAELPLRRRQALALGASALAWNAAGTVAAVPGNGQGQSSKGYGAGGYGDGGYGE